MGNARQQINYKEVKIENIQLLAYKFLKNTHRCMSFPLVGNPSEKDMTGIKQLEERFRTSRNDNYCDYISKQESQQYPLIYA